jgi:DNA-binding transcriptional MocR family regulator
LLSERLTYGVLREVARVAGVKVIGIDLDADGIVPEALEDACRKYSVGALYTNPTFHNPTTSIMSEPRRRAIAAIARRYGFSVIEDDPIGRLYPQLPRPMAELDRDVTWFICGLTKCIAQAARIAYIVAPEPSMAKALIYRNERLTNWVPAPLMAAIAGEMMRSGTATEIAQAIAEESIAREDIARRLLTQHRIVSRPGSLHMWLPLPAPITQQQAVAAAADAGVLVRPASMFTVDSQPPPQAIRLSLSSPLNRDDVRRGAETLAQVLHEIFPRPALAV